MDTTASFSRDTRARGWCSSSPGGEWDEKAERYDALRLFITIP